MRPLLIAVIVWLPIACGAQFTVSCELDELDGTCICQVPEVPPRKWGLAECSVGPYLRCCEDTDYPAVAGSTCACFNTPCAPQQTEVASCGDPFK
jgi:hypothetical protein